MNEVYNTIRTIRNKKGFSQEYMAEQLGMNQSGYAKLEKGGTQLTIERLEQIAIIFDITIHELFPAKDENSTSIANKEIKQLEKRISELEEQLEDKRRILNVIKRSFRSDFSSKYYTLLAKYAHRIDTIEMAIEYANKYNTPELIVDFKKMKAQMHPLDPESKIRTFIYFILPEFEEKIFEELFFLHNTFDTFSDLGLLTDNDFDLLNTYIGNKTKFIDRWKNFIKKKYEQSNLSIANKDSLTDT